MGAPYSDMLDVLRSKRENREMVTPADITQRDRDAVSLALYECMLAASCALQNDVERLQTEAFLTSPSREAWAAWKARRRLVDDPRRESDAAK